MGKPDTLIFDEIVAKPADKSDWDIINKVVPPKIDGFHWAGATVLVTPPAKITPADLEKFKAALVEDYTLKPLVKPSQKKAKAKKVKDPEPEAGPTECPNCGVEVAKGKGDWGAQLTKCEGCQKDICSYCQGANYWFAVTGDTKFYSVCEDCKADTDLCKICHGAVWSDDATTCNVCNKIVCDNHYSYDEEQDEYVCHVCEAGVKASGDPEDYKAQLAKIAAEKELDDGCGVSARRGSSPESKVLDAIHEPKSGWAERSKDWDKFWRIDQDLSPTKSAATFYLLEPIEHNLDTGEIAEPMLLIMGEEAKTARAKLIEACDLAFREYVDMAIGGELRYHVAVGGNRHISKYRSAAWVDWRHLRAAGGPDVLVEAARLFRQMSGGSVGGEPWAVACDILHARETGRITPAQWVDRVFTMQHNTGSMLNKIAWGPDRLDTGQAIKEEVGPAHDSDPTGWSTLMKHATPEAKALFKEWLVVSNRNRMRWRMKLWPDPMLGPAPFTIADWKRITGYFNKIFKHWVNDIGGISHLSSKQRDRYKAVHALIEERAKDHGVEYLEWLIVSQQYADIFEPYGRKFMPIRSQLRRASSYVTFWYYLKPAIYLTWMEYLVGISSTPFTMTTMLEMMTAEYRNVMLSYLPKLEFLELHEHFADKKLTLAA